MQLDSKKELRRIAKGDEELMAIPPRAVGSMEKQWKDKCLKCGETHKNIMANDDNYDLIIKLSVVN